MEKILHQHMVENGMPLFDIFVDNLHNCAVWQLSGSMPAISSHPCVTGVTLLLWFVGSFIALSAAFCFMICFHTSHAAMLLQRFFPVLFKILQPLFCAMNARITFGWRVSTGFDTKCFFVGSCDEKAWQ